MENRGFKYGDGFFETIRIHHGQIPLWEEHVKRISEAFQVLCLDVIPHWSWENLKEEILASEGGVDELIVRLNFYRSGGGTYQPNFNEFTYNFQFRPVSSSSPFLFSKDEWASRLEGTPLPEVKMSVYPVAKQDAYPWSSFKTLSSIFYVQAALWAQNQEQVDEAIVKGEGGEILETGTANILIYHKGQWKAPEWGRGQVKGVYLSALSKVLDIHFDVISYQMLKESDLVLCCNAAKGVRRILLTK
jgi:branched-subunit amino acid aminotransferase/4-amino-4-deoxychorismate lyase